MKSFIYFVLITLSMFFVLVFSMRVLRKALIKTFKLEIKQHSKKMIDLLEKFDKEQTLINDLLLNEASPVVATYVVTWFFSFMQISFVMTKINVSNNIPVGFSSFGFLTILISLFLTVPIVYLTTNLSIKIFIKGKSKYHLFELIKRTIAENSEIENLTLGDLDADKNSFFKALRKQIKKRRIKIKIKLIFDSENIRKKVINNQGMFKNLLKVWLILKDKNISLLNESEIELLEKIVNKTYEMIGDSECVDEENQKKLEMLENM